MKIGTVAGTNDSTTTIATNDMVQEHVTNFTKELFGYIANGIGDDISSIARTMLGEVLEKVDDWQIERFQQSIQDDKISFTIQTDYSEKYSMLSTCSLKFSLSNTLRTSSSILSNWLRKFSPSAMIPKCPVAKSAYKTAPTEPSVSPK